MKTRPSAPPPVRWITRTLEEAGYETWAVGGAVRDALLGHPSGDWDLATRATPKVVRRLFRRTVPIGVEHGTVGVLARDGTLYEVTTFRRDVETDGRHAVVAFADTIDEDLARRDFTINAVAWHAIREVLHDPFGGGEDLDRAVLRTVGVPADRFQEDFLRILRALRFAGRFGLEIEASTWDALCAHVDRLSDLSAERIREELVKVLDADPAPETSLDLYARSGAMRVLYPELDELRGRPPAIGSEAEASAWSLAVASAAALPAGRPWLRLAALLLDVPPDKAAALLVRLRLSNLQTDRIALIAGAAPLPGGDADAAECRRWLSVHGVELLPAIARVRLARAKAEAALGLRGSVEAAVASWCRLRAVRSEGPPLTVGDLALDGRDLIALGLKPGPEFKTILADLLDWVLVDPARNETGLLVRRALEHADRLREE